MVRDDCCFIVSFFSASLEIATGCRELVRFASLVKVAVVWRFAGTCMNGKGFLPLLVFGASSALGLGHRICFENGRKLS